MRWAPMLKDCSRCHAVAGTIEMLGQQAHSFGAGYTMLLGNSASGYSLQMYQNYAVGCGSGMCCGLRVSVYRCMCKYDLHIHWSVAVDGDLLSFNEGQQTDEGGQRYRSQSCEHLVEKS